MILKNGCPVLICAALLAWARPSAADGYRPDQFLGLDLSKAVLSPKPLGPETHFAPVPVEASDHAGEAAQARAAPKPAPHVVVSKTRIAKTHLAKPRSAKTHLAKTRIAKIRIAHARAVKPYRAVRTRLARHHGNPMDAEAFDTRIQVWPCNSGGICNWR